MSMLQDMRALLDEAKADDLTRYSDEWQARAVATLNEYYLDHLDKQYKMKVKE